MLRILVFCLFFAQFYSQDLFRNFLENENISDSLSIQNYKSEFDGFLVRISKEIDKDDTIYDQNEELFEILHKDYFEKYSFNTSLSGIFDKKEYNCVSATFLYCLVAKYLGYQFKIILTPTHVYPLIVDGVKYIRIELTSPTDGFNYNEDKDMLIKFLLDNEFITPAELNEKGEQTIYSEYIERSKEISLSDLILISKSNIALEKMDIKDYKSAFKISYELVKDRKTFFDKEYSTFYNAFTGLAQEYYQQKNLDDLKEITLNTVKLDTVPETLNEQLFSYSRYLCLEYATRLNDFSTAENLFSSVNDYFVQRKIYEDQLGDLYKNINLQKAYRLSIKGKGKEAFDIITALYNKYPSDFQIKDQYINGANGNAHRLASKGKFDDAIKFIKPIYEKNKDYHNLKDTYIRLILGKYSSKRFYYEKNPKQAKKLLLEAYNIDPENEFASEGIAQHYHLKAMKWIRENKLVRAKQEVKKGLKYAPKSDNLLDDLELINQQMKK